MKCPKCGSEMCDRGQDSPNYIWWCIDCDQPIIIEPRGHTEKVKEYTWEQIQPDDAGDYEEVSPGVFRKVKE